MSASARVAIVIVILLLLPVVFGPIVIGLLIERGVEQVLAANVASGIDVEFERGLYTSRARTSLAIEGSDGTGGALAAEHVIVHGPIPLAAPAIGRSPFDLAIVLVHSRVSPDPATMPGVAEALGDAPLVSVFTRVTSQGDVEALIDAPPFELGGGRLIWAGLTGRIDARDRFDRISGELAAEGLRLADDQVSLVLQSGQATFDADLVAGRLAATLEQSGSEWVFGDRRFASGAIRIEADQPLGGDLLGDARSRWRIERLAGAGGLDVDDFEMTDLELEQLVAFDAETGLHRGELGLAFASWRVGAVPADGPGGFRVHVERIDRAAVERFRNALQELEQSGASPEDIEAMRPLVVMDQLPGLLQTSPVFEVRDGFVESPDGRLDARLRVTVDGSEPALLGDPFMLMSLIEAHASVEGPEPLVRRLAERLLPAASPAPPEAVPPGTVISDPDAGLPVEGAADAGLAGEAEGPPVDRVAGWLESGTLVRDGDRVRFEARFTNGMPMLNGQPADPALITNLMPGM